MSVRPIPFALGLLLGSGCSGPDFDPCSGDITELTGSRVVHVVLGVGGAPLYG